MSDYEIHRGRLIPLIPMDNETPIETLSRVLGDKFNAEDFSEAKSIKKYIEDNYDSVDRDGIVYAAVDEEEKDPEDSFMDFKELADGSFEYHTRFYNRGTCLTEMLEESLDEHYEKAKSKKTY